MTPRERKDAIFRVFAQNPWTWIPTKELAARAGVPMPCYDIIYALKRVHRGVIISRTGPNGPNGGFCYTPKEQGMSQLRGTGRSYKQLEALPDGGLYIVNDISAVWYFRDLLVQMGRSPHAVDFIGLNSHAFEDQLKGNCNGKPIDMDHFARDIASPSQATAFWAAKR